LQPDERDAGYLWDMLDAARSVREITSEATLHEYTTIRVMHRAVERELEIIGEAARRVSEAFKDAHSEVPWQKIIGQRNILAHEYGEVIPERVWAVATENVPTLIAQLEALLPPPSGSEPGN
jgi:uncharacterized protein with HEPN domain